MSDSVAVWRARKDQELHEKLRAAVQNGRVEIYTDQRMLDFQGSPIHNSWDHLLPLLVLMSLALVVLLSTGVAVGIVAMTIGALAHLAGIKHFIAWRIRARAIAYMLESADHWRYIWHLGGIAMIMKGANEPPCLAPKGDWRKFVQRHLPDDPNQPSEPEPAPEQAAAEPPTQPEPEILPP